MNAIPLKPRPQDAIDKLIADHGIGTVFLTVLARLFKRTRLPNIAAHARDHRPRDLNLMDDHLRQDLGLPPREQSRLQIDLMELNRHSIF